MYNQVVQWDNGTVFALTIQDNANIVDISNATIEAFIKYKDNIITKPVTITDGINGKCEFELKSENVENKGTYSFQVVVTFNNGNYFSSDIQQFLVGRKIQK